MVDSIMSVEMRMDGDWLVEFPAWVKLPKGNLIMVPLGGGVLEIVPEWRVAGFIDDLFDRHFGGFNSTSRKHLILRSWLFGHACECRHAGSESVSVPESLRRFAGSGDLPLRIRVSDVKSSGDSCVFDSYWVTPDEQGRIALPRRLSLFLGAAPIAFPSLAGDSIWVVPDEGGLAAYIDGVFNDKFGGFNPENRDYVMLKALLEGSSIIVVLEDECALRLPSELVEKAALGKDVVIVGAGHHVEVYSSQRWAEICAEIGGSTVFGIPQDCG